MSERIPISQGECDCRANGCACRIEVSVRDGKYVIEVHGLDDDLESAAKIANDLAALIRELEKTRKGDSQ